MKMYVVCKPDQKYAPIWLHTLASTSEGCISKFLSAFNYANAPNVWEEYKSLGFELHAIEIVDKGVYEEAA